MPMRYFTLFVFCTLIALYGCSSKVIVYPAPEQEPKSGDFQMAVNGKPVDIYQSRVSKYPINQIWPGYQRPINQTEMASFAYFDFEGEVTIRITSSKEIRTVDIRPKEYGIIPVVKGKNIEFKLTKPVQFVVEVNGYHHALHVFANPVEEYTIDKKDPKVHYFGPGIHEAGRIDVKSGETVFIDGGAIVYGTINSVNTRDIKIIGRGILDASKIERDESSSMIFLKQVTNSTVSGIILRDSHFWAIIPTNCDKVVFDNLKLIGFWRYNSDGLDIVNCKNIQLRNSFIRTFDDNIVIRGTKPAYVEPYKIIENITIDNCVLWNDWGRAIEIGASIVADTIKNITFSNCLIPHFTAVALDIQNCDRGIIKDIRFENISMDGLISDSLMIGAAPIVPRAWGKIAVLGIYSTFYSEDSVRGMINNIYFNNIRYNCPIKKDPGVLVNDSLLIDRKVSFREYDKFIRDNIYFGDIEFNTKNDATFYFSGFDDNHKVENIHLKDYFIDGKKVTDLNTVGINKFVKGIFIE